MIIRIKTDAETSPIGAAGAMCERYPAHGSRKFERPCITMANGAAWDFSPKGQGTFSRQSTL